MFFKSISVCVVIAFLIVIYENVGVAEHPIMLQSETSLSSKIETKKEVLQAPMQQGDASPTKNESESRVILGVIGKLFPQNIYVGDKNNPEIGAYLQDKAKVESLPSFQYSLHTLDYNALIPTRDIMDTTQQKKVIQERSDSVLISPFVKEAP